MKLSTCDSIAVSIGQPVAFAISAASGVSTAEAPAGLASSDNIEPTSIIAPKL
jgi:hypothetical protein